MSSNDRKASDIDKRTNTIAQKLKIEDKMEQHTTTPAFITLKDHKENFATKNPCRLINSAKSNLGIVSKKILEKIIMQTHEDSGHNLWRSSSDVLKWFEDLSQSPKSRFSKFDVQEFYPSITSTLLDKAIDHARSYTTITQDEEEKRTNPEFDVTMGSYDGAESSELVGLYLLSKVASIIDGHRCGLYRDDGLISVENATGPTLDRIRKKVAPNVQRRRAKNNCRAIR